MSTTHLRCPAGCNVQWAADRDDPTTHVCWACGAAVLVRPSMADKGPSDEVSPPTLTGKGVPDGALTGGLQEAS